MHCDKAVTISSSLLMTLAEINKNPYNCESRRDIYYTISISQKKLLLVQCEVDSNGDSYRSTYHWVVTHTEEAHHLYVSRN